MSKPIDFNAFRRDRAEHARLGAVVRETATNWRCVPGNAEVLDELERFGNGAPLDGCRRLHELTTSVALADMFCRDWTQSIAALLAKEPLAQPANAHQQSRYSSTMRLAQQGGAELSLVCHDVRGTNRSQAESIQFTDVETHDIVICGKARVILATRATYAGGEKPETREVLAGTGTTFTQFDGLTSKAFNQVITPLVLLRLTRHNHPQQPTQQISLQDGRLLGQASASKQASCQEVMMAVLGRMGRTDAVPALERVARDGDEHLRWEAMRQCLSLDITKGFALLCDVAASAQDPLSAHAGALRAQLLEAHPQLARLEREQCPA